MGVLEDIPDFETLEEAKQYLRDHLKEGARCPACTQLAKIYERPMYWVSAYSLIQLYKLDSAKHGFYHITKLVPKNTSGGGDFAKLVYWGLAEEMSKDPADKQKRTSGMWQITPKGRNFVEGSLTVQSHVRLYDGRLLGFKGEYVSIRDISGKKFDYEELMGEYYAMHEPIKPVSLFNDSGTNE